MRRMGRQNHLKMGASELNKRRAIILVLASSTLYTLLAASLGASASSVNNTTQVELNARYSFTFAADPTRDRANEGDDAIANQNTSVTLYKEPSSLLVSILKELFSDIDWQAIENARVQIEKFIHKVDRIVGSFKTIISKATNGGSGASSRSRDGRWWTLGDKNKTPSAAAAAADTTNVKEMLERVACYVGYVRLMNLSNEALAELDASKLVSSLFGGAGASAGGMSAKRNASLWGWLG